MKASVLKHLIHIFEAVADACDGGHEVPADIQDAYYTAMRVHEFQMFYGERVDRRSQEVFGRKEV